MGRFGMRAKIETDFANRPAFLFVPAQRDQAVAEFPVGVAQAVPILNDERCGGIQFRHVSQPDHARFFIEMPCPRVVPGNVRRETTGRGRPLKRAVNQERRTAFEHIGQSR